MKDASPDISKDGLQRLQRAIQGSTSIHHVTASRSDGKEKMRQFCLCWQPADTYETFSERHPEWGSPKRVQQKLWRVRRKIPGLPRNYHFQKYQIAQAYLAMLPEHLRRPQKV